jgi:prohibitin 2
LVCPYADCVRIHVVNAAQRNGKTAQQEAQRASFIVDRAKQEKQSIIVKAEGEAKSATLIGDAVKNNPGFLELRKLETAKEIAETVASSKNRVYLDSDALLLNVRELLTPAAAQGSEKSKW